jgi:hypothetical protein
LSTGARFCSSCGAKIPEAYIQKNEVQAISSKTAQAAGEKPHDIQYFSSSMWRLSILCVVTFGLYEIYWFFKNWQAVERHTNAKLSPFWRSVFPFFFCNDLFKKILASARSHGYTEEYSSGWLTLAFIGLSATSRLPDPFWFIALMNFIPLLIAQRAINFNNSRALPESAPNDIFSAWEVALLVVGAIAWILVFAGLTM